MKKYEIEVEELNSKGYRRIHFKESGISFECWIDDSLFPVLEVYSVTTKDGVKLTPNHNQDIIMDYHNELYYLLDRLGLDKYYWVNTVHVG